MYKLLFLALSLWQTSIYTIQYNTIDGHAAAFSTCQGKKILIVNIATGSSKASQLEGLEQLNQKYKDSLVIIAFPSNAFGNESRSNAEIKSFCENSYHTTFQLAQKGQVTGPGRQSIYSWLATMNENGVMDAPIVEDFQKFLIDKDGSIIGGFASSVEPMDSLIQSAITN